MNIHVHTHTHTHIPIFTSQRISLILSLTRNLSQTLLISLAARCLLPNPLCLFFFQFIDQIYRSLFVPYSLAPSLCSLALSLPRNLAPSLSPSLTPSLPLSPYCCPKVAEQALSTAGRRHSLAPSLSISISVSFFLYHCPKVAEQTPSTIRVCLSLSLSLSLRTPGTR